jgi:hypothetical protein
LRELGTRVDAAQFVGRRLHGGHALTVGAGDLDHVRQIVFPLFVVVPHYLKPVAHLIRLRAQHASIAQPLSTFGFSGVNVLDHALNEPVMSDHPPIARRIGGPHG